MTVLKRRNRVLAKLHAQLNRVNDLQTRNLVDVHSPTMMPPKCGALETSLQPREEFEFANRVIDLGRKKTRTTICTDFTFTFSFHPR